MFRQRRRRYLHFPSCSFNAGYGVMSTPRRARFNTTRRFRSDERAQAQIEALLSIIFVLILVIGIIEMIVLIYTYTVLADASKEGVRYAIVHGCDLSSASCSGTCTPACTDTTGANVRTYVRTFLGASLHDPA